MRATIGWNIWCRCTSPPSALVTDAPNTLDWLLGEIISITDLRAIPLSSTGVTLYEASLS